MVDNNYIIRGPVAEDFIAFHLEDCFLFAQDGDFTSLFKLKIISLAGKFDHEKSGPDDNEYFKFNNKKQALERIDL